MRVEQLWRYPVKSVGGESLPAVDVRRAGFAGDRRVAVHNERGEVTWAGAVPGLMRVIARADGDSAELTVPGGDRFRADAPDAGARLSAAVVAPVTLAPHRPTDPGTALHVLTTASLASLRRALPDSAIDVTRFRPNLLLAGAPDESRDGYPEASWIGRRLAIGGVRLRFSAPCDRCAMITKETPSVPHDRTILRWVARELGNCFGVYAAVEVPGQLRVGDDARWCD